MGAGLGTSFRLSDQAQINLTGKYAFVDGGDLSINFNRRRIDYSL